MKPTSTHIETTPEVPPFADLIDEHELGRRTNISASTWRKYRLDGRSPPYLKVGKHVRYVWTDVCRWLEGKRRYSTAPTREEQRIKRPRKTQSA